MECFFRKNDFFGMIVEGDDVRMPIALDIELFLLFTKLQNIILQRQVSYFIRSKLQIVWLY
jgi:hypothetical protein